jgi:hypothetical protein
MPSLLGLDDDAQSSNLLGIPGVDKPQIAQPDPDRPDQGAALADLYQRVSDEMARQQQISADRGLWANGAPTAKGAIDAAQQYGSGLLFGTTAPDAPGFTAFHGSPHDFDAFDTSKIGTGEGAQAYGHGLYFAGNEGVARSYRDNLVGDDPNLGVEEARSLLNAYGGDFGAALKANPEQWRDPNGWEAKQVDAVLKHWQEHGTESTPPDFSGKMYEVNVNADPAHFLDWDAKVGAHPDAVRDKLLDMGYGDPDLGRDVYLHMSGGRGGPEAATQRLLDAGIPGIKYLDQGSRAEGKGTSNHVIFDANTIAILRKYGIAGLMLGGGAAATQRGNGT